VRPGKPRNACRRSRTLAARYGVTCPRRAARACYKRGVMPSSRCTCCVGNGGLTGLLELLECGVSHSAVCPAGSKSSADSLASAAFRFATVVPTSAGLPLNVLFPPHPLRSWQNCVDPSVSREPWALAEDRAIFGLRAELGNRWVAIAARMPGRSDNAVKNRFYSTLRRLARAQNVSSKEALRTIDAGSVSDDALLTMLQDQHCSAVEQQSMPSECSATPPRDSAPRARWGASQRADQAEAVSPAPARALQLSWSSLGLGLSVDTSFHDTGVAGLATRSTVSLDSALGSPKAGFPAFMPPPQAGGVLPCASNVTSTRSSAFAWMQQPHGSPATLAPDSRSFGASLAPLYRDQGIRVAKRTSADRDAASRAGDESDWACTGGAAGGSGSPLAARPRIAMTAVADDAGASRMGWDDQASARLLPRASTGFAVSFSLGAEQSTCGSDGRLLDGSSRLAWHLAAADFAVAEERQMLKAGAILGAEKLPSDAAAPRAAGGDISVGDTTQQPDASRSVHIPRGHTPPVDLAGAGGTFAGAHLANAPMLGIEDFGRGAGRARSRALSVVSAVQSVDSDSLAASEFGCRSHGNLSEWFGEGSAGVTAQDVADGSLLVPTKDDLGEAFGFALHAEDEVPGLGLPGLGEDVPAASPCMSIPAGLSGLMFGRQPPTELGPFGLC